MTISNVQLPPAQAHLLEESLANVREALSGLEYGHILLTIHAGKLVQIDVTEKKRIRMN